MRESEINELAQAVARELGITPAGSADAKVHEPLDSAWRMPVVSDRGVVVGSSVGVSGADVESTDRVSVRGGGGGDARVADFVDHTLLKAEATRGQIETLCREAIEYQFAAVCVNGSWVRLCSEMLSGSKVKIAAVAGFPLGATTTGSKVSEARELVQHGADEIDMVAAIGRIIDNDWDFVEDDIAAVVEAAQGRTVKVILETAALEPLQIVKAAALSKEAGAHFVKTSTGFHPAGGATPEAVALLRLAVGDSLGVKAAGGVRDCVTALRVIAAGANRIGTSNGVSFVECLGPGPRSLSELLADPERHESSCRTGECPATY